MIDSAVGPSRGSAPAEDPRESLSTSPASEPVSTPYLNVAGYAAAVWLGTRVAFLLLTHMYNSWLPTPRIPGCVTGCAGEIGILSSWYRWDAGLWNAVAGTGYSRADLTAFYPGYPLLLRFSTLFVSPANSFTATMVATSLAALAAFICVGILAAQEFGPGAGRGAVLMLAAYPLSFFTYAPYSEALSLAFVAVGLIGARRHRWWLAGLGAFGAALTRPTGALVAIPIAWEIGRAYWPADEARRQLRWGVVVPQLAALAAAPVAILGYMAYLWRRWGDPLVGVHAEQIYWARKLASPLHTAHRVWDFLPTIVHGGQVGFVFGIDLGALLLFLLVPLLMIRTLPPSLTLYSLSVVALTFSLAARGFVPGGVDPLLSMGRFMLVGVPVFVGLGRVLDRRPALAAVLPAAFLVQAVLALQFMNWNWVE